MQTLPADMESVESVVSVDVTLEDIVRYPHYVHYYQATHPDFLSTVIVVLWNSNLPGPSTTHEGIPVVYVAASCGAAIEESWNERTVPSPQLTEADINAAREITSVIRTHQAHLFAKHSNLVAVRCDRQGPEGGLGFCIEFVVAGKGFKVVADLSHLPTTIDGVPTKVTHGWVKFCGKVERGYHRPLLPGAGIAVAADAHLDLTEKDYNPLICTLGGAFAASDHCLQSGIHGKVRRYFKLDDSGMWCWS